MDEELLNTSTFERRFADRKRDFRERSSALYAQTQAENAKHGGLDTEAAQHIKDWDCRDQDNQEG